MIVVLIILILLIVGIIGIVIVKERKRDSFIPCPQDYGKYISLMKEARRSLPDVPNIPDEPPLPNCISSYIGVG